MKTQLFILTSLLALGLNAQPCSPTVTYSVIPGTNVVNFTVDPNSVPNADFFGYGWNFGDNSSQGWNSSTTVSHNYMFPGSYTATLYAYGASNNCITTLSFTLTEPLAGCYAYYTFQPSLINFGSYNFQGIAGGGSAPYTYVWNFGATSTNSQSNLNLGTNNICLDIMDMMGCSSTFCQEIYGNPNPIIPIVYYNTPPTSWCDGLLGVSTELLSCNGTLICEPSGSVDFSSMWIEGDTVFFHTCLEVTGIGMMDEQGGLCASGLVNTGGLEEGTQSILTIYPNPSNEFITIQRSKSEDFVGEVFIYNIDGQLCKTINSYKSGEQLLLPVQSGIYLLKVLIDGQEFQYRVVKN